MPKTLKLYTVDTKYNDFLRSRDDNIRDNSGNKSMRPYVGTIIMINNRHYLAPLASPKPKFNHMKDTIDFIKIDNGKYGAIDLNNMIPVERSLCQLIDINNEQDPFRKILWRNEARWIRANGKSISSKAKLLYEQYINNTLPDHVKNRCANFPRLEKLLDKYMQKQQVKKYNKNGLSIY